MKFTYTGTGETFAAFLNVLVRDYLQADDPAAIPEDKSVKKVESSVA